MHRTFWIEPGDKPGLLLAVMKLVAGNSRSPLEGKISAEEFSVIPGVIAGRIDPFDAKFGVPSRMVIGALARVWD